MIRIGGEREGGEGEQRWRQCVMIRAELTHLDEIYISAFHRIASDRRGEENAR